MARWRRRRGAAPAVFPAALPELKAAWWETHNLSMSQVRFGAIARRLPAMLAQAVTIAWRANRRDTVAALGLNLLTGVATAVWLLATRGVLREVFATGATLDRLRAAVPALVTVALATATRSGLSIAAGWAEARLEPQVLTVVERRLFELTTLVELAAFDDAGFSDDMDRARNRGALSAQLLVRGTVDFAAGLAGLVGTAAALLVLHPVLLLALVAASGPAGWAAVRAARLSYLSNHARTSRRRRLWMLSDLMANRATGAELRAFTMRRFLLAEHAAMSHAETEAELDVVRRQSLTRLAGGVLSGLATAGVYVLLAVLLLRGILPLAAAGAAVLAMQAARQSLALALTNVNRVYEEGLYFGDYTEFCARAFPRIPAVGGGAVAALPAPTRIRLDRVSLRYPDTDTSAVADASLTVHHGQTIALVGENGSGKTSLAKLIAGLYRPTSGRVYWNATPLDEARPELVWEHVALVSQEYWHWPFTAERNIRLGTDDTPGHADDAVAATVRAAAVKAGAHMMIDALPDGYRTLLSRNFAGGHDLSGGEWQRLAAARAFYRDAPVLICDEPSAALDARAEHALFAALRDGARERITVLITHRLANVRHADHIYVLHHGYIVEAGTHAELMAAGGRYAELYTLQAAGYADEVTGAAGPRPV